MFTHKSIFGIVAVACVLSAAGASAKDHDVTVALRVSAQGLDLNKPADAEVFYGRLKNAARVVCTHGDRVDLVPVDDPKGCLEKALADAVRSVKAPLLTQVYVANHMAANPALAWSSAAVAPSNEPKTDRR